MIVNRVQPSQDILQVYRSMARKLGIMPEILSFRKVSASRINRCGIRSCQNNFFKLKSVLYQVAIQSVQQLLWEVLFAKSQYMVNSDGQAVEDDVHEYTEVFFCWQNSFPKIIQLETLISIEAFAGLHLMTNSKSIIFLLFPENENLCSFHLYLCSNEFQILLNNLLPPDKNIDTKFRLSQAITSGWRRCAIWGSRGRDRWLPGFTSPAHTV